ncbi:hypothetical protein PMAYCL1PPCAC_21327, partial [Pristionchus mayeri]
NDTHLTWDPNENNGTTGVKFETNNFTKSNIISKCFRTTTLEATTEEVQVWHDGVVEVTSWSLSGRNRFRP